MVVVLTVSSLNFISIIILSLSLSSFNYIYSLSYSHSYSNNNEKKNQYQYATCLLIFSSQFTLSLTHIVFIFIFKIPYLIQEPRTRIFCVKWFCFFVMEAGEDCCVKVAVHVRPLINDEKLQGCKDCVTVVSGKPQVHFLSTMWWRLCFWYRFWLVNLREIWIHDWLRNWRRLILHMELFFVIWWCLLDLDVNFFCHFDWDILRSCLENQLN